MEGYTDLALDVAAFIVAVGGSAQRGARLVAAGDTTTLREVLFTLGPTDLDLLLLAATAQLIRLEGALGLEGRAAVLGDVLVGHGWGNALANSRVEGWREGGRWLVCLRRGIYLSLRGAGSEKAKRKALASGSP